MHGLELLLVSVLVAFAQGKNSSQLANWKSSWIQGGLDAAPGEFPYMAFEVDNNSLLKPDLVVINDSAATIIDITVRYEEGNSLSLAIGEKKLKYASLEMVVRTLHPRVECVTVQPLVFGARGALPPETRDSLKEWGFSIREMQQLILGVLRASVRSVDDNEHDCGGSIINHWYIMTVAHCVLSKTAPKIKVVVGSNQLRSGGRTYGVARIIRHRAYNKYSDKNDIALLKLVRPVVYSSKVQPVTLPNKDETTAVGTSCIFMGWGKTSSSASSFPNNLQKLKLNIISNTDCSKYYLYIYDTKICAVGGDSRKALCEGDSGGPLMCHGKQVGIYRGGGNPGTICTNPLPPEFVYVSKFIDWIQQHAV